MHSHRGNGFVCDQGEKEASKRVIKLVKLLLNVISYSYMHHMNWYTYLLSPISLANVSTTPTNFNINSFVRALGDCILEPQVKDILIFTVNPWTSSHPMKNHFLCIDVV